MHKPLELIFLHTLGTQLCIHKSQFEEFAKAMFEAGYFTNNSGKFGVYEPKEDFSFYRLLDKSGTTLSPYIWEKNHSYPRPIKNKRFIWGEWAREQIEADSEKTYRDMLLGNFIHQPIQNRRVDLGKIGIITNDKLCPP